MNIPARNILLATALAASLMPALASALTIQVSYGATTLTCNDGQACDGATTSNVITDFVNNIGPFTISINTGANSGASLGQSLLNLTSFSVSGGSTGSTPLIISVSDTGYTGPSPTLFNFASTLNQGAGISVSYKAYMDAGNTLFGTGTLLGQQNLVSNSLNASAANNLLGSFTPNAGPYSMTLVAEVSTSNAGSVLATSDIAASPVPLPAALPLLISGMGLLGGVMRRRRAT